MKKGITFIVAWLVISVLVGGGFIEAIPPGGVDWPYYLPMAGIPLGAFLYARHSGKTLVAFSFGLLAGGWFALPVFDDARAVLAGRTTVGAVALKDALFAVAMALVCSAAFAAGRRFYRRN